MKSKKAPAISKTGLTSEIAIWRKLFPYAITSVFFVLSLVGILHHEMWRDEYQAWMIAADAHSLPELFRNLKYDGHPALWHTFLFIISACTDDPKWMQLFHILISTTSIFLFNRYAPFPLIQKILFSFGYFTLFEYNLISRCYGLGLLLIVIYCILYPNRKKYILYLAAVLFLLANDSAFGLILTVCFSGVLLYGYFFAVKNEKKSPVPFYHLVLFMGIVFSGIILSYLQIRPEPDNSFISNYITHFDKARFHLVLSRFLDAYISFPDISTIHFWNTNLLIGNGSTLPIFLSPALFLLGIIAFMRYRLVVSLLIIGTAVLVAFYYYTGLMYLRYTGHLFIVLVSCYWLIYYQKEHPFENKVLNTLSLAGNKIRAPLFISILVIQFCSGITAYGMDLKYPFSTSAKAVSYIQDNHLDKYDIVGSIDHLVSPLAAQLKKKILYVERKEYGSFIIYDQKRKDITSFSAIQDLVIAKEAQDHHRIIMVRSSPIFKQYNDNGQWGPWDEGMLSDSLHMKWLVTIEPGIVEDETYYIYQIDEVGSQ